MIKRGESNCWTTEWQLEAPSRFYEDWELLDCRGMDVSESNSKHFLVVFVHPPLGFGDNFTKKEGQPESQSPLKLNVLVAMSGI